MLVSCFNLPEQNIWFGLHFLLNSLSMTNKFLPLSEIQSEERVLESKIFLQGEKNGLK